MEKQQYGGVRIGHDSNNIGKVSEKKSMVENFLRRLAGLLEFFETIFL